MDYRNYSWANSISTILKKTEQNLERGHSSIPKLSDDFRNSSIILPSPTVDSFVREKKSFLFENEDLYGPSNEPQNFKTMVMDKLAFQQKEIEKLKRKYSNLQKSDMNTYEVKEDVDMAIAAIEKRLLNEVRRVENAQKTLVTMEILRDSEEFVKNSHLDHINQLEISFQNLRSDCERFQTNFARNSEEIGKNLEKKLGSLTDIKKLKEIIAKENECIFAEINSKYQEIDKKYFDYVDKLYEEIYKIQGQAEKSMKTMREALSNNENKLALRSENTEEKLNSVLQKHKEDVKALSIQFKQNDSLDDIQSELRGLQRKISKLPDFSEFARKSDLIEISETIPDLKLLKIYATKAEVQSLLDDKPSMLQISGLPTKSDLEMINKVFLTKIDEVKSILATKKELISLKQQMPQSSCQENCTKLALGIKENKKSNDTLIQKLVQLEQRMSLLEESDSISESLPQLPIGKLNPEPTTSLITDYGSKETDYSVPQFSLSTKDASAVKFNVEDFINKLTEEFITGEIGMGVENVVRKRRASKFQVPKLKFPVIPSESSPDSGDDLNNAVILNTDLTNKSESPIDFSLI